MDAIRNTAYAYDSVGQLLCEDGHWSSNTVSHTFQNRLRTSLVLVQMSTELLLGGVSLSAETGLNGRVFTNIPAMNQSTRGPGWGAYSTGFYVRGPGLESKPFYLPFDLVTNLCAEIASPDFIPLVCEPDPNSQGYLPKFRWAVCFEGDLSLFSFRVEKSSTDIDRRFEERVRHYMEGRCEGHSSNYVFCSVAESKTASYSLPTNFPVAYKERYWIPSGWVHTNSVRIVGGRQEWFIIDGLLAWSLFNGEIIGPLDAKEFDPKLAAQFEQARKEALANLKKLNAEQSRIGFYEEMKRILREKFGIKWYSPTDFRYAIVYPP